MIPVHGLDPKSPGYCTCARAKCPNPGKHPVGNGWQKSHRISAADCYTIWREDPRRLNAGIRTGVASGIFVLDVDPKNGGDDNLLALVSRYGGLPDTYTVRTPSGGWHFYFQLPNFPVTNSPGGLPDGLDIRGDGGQVVAPGSSSGAGGLYTIHADLPTAPAPAWLLEIIKTAANRPAAEVVMAADLPTRDQLTTQQQERAYRYALKVIEMECQEYTDAPWGKGNPRLFVTCCNILEIIQSPWSGVEVDYARGRLELARSTRHANAVRTNQRDPRTGEYSGQSPEEVETTWASASRRVKGKGRPLPDFTPDDSQWEGILFTAPPVTGSGVVTSPFMQPSEAEAAAIEALEGVEITEADRAQFAAAEQAAKWEAAVRQEAERQAIRDAAIEYRKTGGMGGGANGVTEDAIAALAAKVLDADDLDDLPNPEPLIVDVLDMDSESWIIGAPGGFKSFVALDWAGHVGSGLEWQSKRTRQGTVLYVVAEGAKGIKLRKKAWVEAYGPMRNVKFLPEPVQVKDTQAWAVLVEYCRRLGPVFIILDTQARITVGLNENTSELGVAIDAIRQMRAATGACVLVVHHTGRDGANARGWSGIDGAQDSEIKVTRPEGPERKLLTAEIAFEKQKDAGEDGIFQIKMQEHDWGRDAVTGRKLSSLSIAPMAPFTQAVKKLPKWEADLTENQALVLTTLREHTDERGITMPTLLQLINDRANQGVGTFIERTSLRSALLALKKRTDKGRPIVTEDGARFILSEHLPE